MSKISDQLTVLRKNNLVTFEKDGTMVMYQINKPFFLDMLNSYYDSLNLKTNGYKVGCIKADPFSEECFQIFKILANETRCEMLIKISQKERYVNELCDMFYLEQPTISMHLNYIHKHDIIKFRKNHTKKFYYMNKATA